MDYGLIILIYWRRWIFCQVKIKFDSICMSINSESKFRFLSYIYKIAIKGKVWLLSCEKNISEIGKKRKNNKVNKIVYNIRFNNQYVNKI